MLIKSTGYPSLEKFQICPEFMLTRHNREFMVNGERVQALLNSCLLYTSDAADEDISV